MEQISIQINWVYFLGIIGSLILISWYSGSRFSGIEKDIEWIKKLIDKLSKGQQIESDNSREGLFASNSPVMLTPKGKELLDLSGFKQYIDKNKSSLIEVCGSVKEKNPYEVQEYIFNLFDTKNFGKDFEEGLKKRAFEAGITVATLRRIGAIHFRSMCLDNFGMAEQDIDKHDPNKN